jgi:hypothetical protein
MERAGDVIGMDVSVERECQPQPEPLKFLEIAVDAVDHGIDEYRNTRVLAADEIRVGARQGLEKLSEEHVICPVFQAVDAAIPARNPCMADSLDATFACRSNLEGPGIVAQWSQT